MKKIDKNLFKMDALGHCGVLMPSHVMKKVVKLQDRYIHEIRCLLNEHKDELIPYSWTMAYEKDQGGNAVYANYISSNFSVEERIKSFKVEPPVKVDCMESHDYDAVKQWCEEEYLKQFKSKDEAQS
jgi:hypothetical protein